MTDSPDLQEFLEKFIQIQQTSNEAMELYEASIRILSDCITTRNPNAQAIADMMRYEMNAIHMRCIIATDPEFSGKTAFEKGIPREHCPFPAPFKPIRYPADLDAGPNSLGAKWLVGWDKAKSDKAIQL